MLASKADNKVKNTIAIAVFMLCACFTWGQDVSFEKTETKNVSFDKYIFVTDVVVASCPDGTPFATLETEAMYKRNKKPKGTMSAVKSPTTKVTGHCHYRGEEWSFTSLEKAETWVNGTYSKQSCGDTECHYQPPTPPTHVVIDK